MSTKEASSATAGPVADSVLQLSTIARLGPAGATARKAPATTLAGTTSGSSTDRRTADTASAKVSGTWWVVSATSFHRVE